MSLLASNQKRSQMTIKLCVQAAERRSFSSFTSVRGSMVTRHEVEVDVSVGRITCGSPIVTAYLINLAATFAWPTRQPTRNTEFCIRDQWLPKRSSVVSLNSPKLTAPRAHTLMGPPSNIT